MQLNSFLISIYLAYKFCLIGGKSYYKLALKGLINKSTTVIPFLAKILSIYCVVAVG